MTEPTPGLERAAKIDYAGPSFIETQLPVARLSKESYAERTAKQSQTLTGQGKWWGRKPLVLCRAAILGLLLPATADPAKDREVFLRLMTMDDDGLLRRKSSNIAAADIFNRLPPSERGRYFDPDSAAKPRYRRGLTAQEKEELQRRVFLSLSYDERMKYCDRPEQIDGPSPESWHVINAHLGTSATSLVELARELGQRRFGHIPCVGDSFCGGGSILFEAARLGCDAYGSDLNPLAAMLTWASLSIVGGGEAVADMVKKIHRKVFDKVDEQVTEWGIEHREADPLTGRRWRADAYLYCVESVCPECGWRVPLVPSWVIGKGTMTIGGLEPDEERKRFHIRIRQGVSAAEMKAANATRTVKDSQLLCPHCHRSTPIRALRGDGRGAFGDSRSLLRAWENRDMLPREDDIFGERLYCIRWVDSWRDEASQTHREKHYLESTQRDIGREKKVLALLVQRFETWQRAGHIPQRYIEPGAETTRLGRERGWTYWHHLFSPRQLLVNGLLAEKAHEAGGSLTEQVSLSLGVCRCADWNSRLCRWHPSAANEKGEQTFDAQALDTLFTFSVRPLNALRTTWFARINSSLVSGNFTLAPDDARQADAHCDLWLTDPPYADAINYEEISEFFLAWQGARIKQLFPAWYDDSKRALAVKGSDDSFRKAMVACYRRLAERMPDNGLQVVMFTHQDAGVWADLAIILWAADLRVTAAWCIATEIDTALKEGNYVQGTVLMVVRKQVNPASCFLDEAYREVEAEVPRQLDAMLKMDDLNEPNFSDTDYQLAAYAAALRVLTSKKIEEIDVNYELTRVRQPGEVSPVEQVIRNAVTIACNYLVPRGVGKDLWSFLTPLERFYLKGLEIESHGERRIGVYQELAKGFGIQEYKGLLASTKANEARLKTAGEFGRKEMGGTGFGCSLVRQALFGINLAAEAEDMRPSLNWFATEIKDYAANRKNLITVLEWLVGLAQDQAMPHWHRDAATAGLLAGALRNREDNV